MTAQGWQPGGTTGDRKLDQAIARFIHDPRTLRCDAPESWADNWTVRACDGRPEPGDRSAPLWSRERPLAGPRELDVALTRGELLEGRR